MSGTSLVRRRAALVASVLALFGASIAVGQVPAKPTPQDTTKAKATTTHIKIQKEREAGGEVVTAIRVPCETVTTTVIDPARDDAIRRDQHTLDSIAASFESQRLMNEMRAAVENARANALAEAMANQQAKDEAAALALKARLARGFYFGVGGGASAPQRGLRDGYTGGYNVTVPVGFDATTSPLGIRADFSVDHMNGTIVRNARFENLSASGDITVWSLNSDLKLRIPTPGGGTRTHLYLLGGVGAHKVTGGIYGAFDPKAGQNLTFNDAGVNFGWNAGAGAAIKWGPAEVFIESRFFSVKSDLAYHTAGGVGTYTTFTPVLVGLQWF